MELKRTLISLIPQLHEEIRWRVFKGAARSQTQEINAILLGLKPPMDLDKLHGEWPPHWTDTDTHRRDLPRADMIWTPVYFPPRLYFALTRRTGNMSRRVNEILTGRTPPYSLDGLGETWPAQWKKPKKK